jgi:hypothetical protein
LTATFVTATALFASATPFASAPLLVALALLAFTFLFVPISLLATAALSAPTLLAALLPSALWFDGFVRITLCFHSTFLCYLLGSLMVLSLRLDFLSFKSAWNENVQSGRRMIV